MGVSRAETRQVNKNHLNLKQRWICLKQYSEFKPENAPFVSDLEVLLLVACPVKLLSILGDVPLPPQAAWDSTRQDKLLQGEDTPDITAACSVPCPCSIHK